MMRAPLRGAGLQTMALPPASTLLMGVTGQRRQRMRDGRDDADHSEGCIFLEGDAVLAAEGLGTEELHAGDAVGDHLELLDLGREPADLRLRQLLAAKLLRLLAADLADAGDGAATVVQPPRASKAASSRPRR